jgi:ketosteroid isomerase-like protein
MSRAIVEQFFHRLGSGNDVDGWLALLDADISVDTPFSPKGTEVHFAGIEAVERRFGDARRRMPELHFLDLEILATEDPQRWLATCRSEGRRGDGRAYRNIYCWLFRIVADKIVWWAEYFDPQEVMAVRAN